MYRVYFNCIVIYFLSFLYYANFSYAVQHPMLYFDSHDVAKLRHRAKTTHVKIAKIIEEAGRSIKDDPKTLLPPKTYEKFAGRWNELYGNNLCAFAMYCVLNPEDEKAMELVSRVIFAVNFYTNCWNVAILS